MLYAEHPHTHTPSGFITARSPLPYAQHIFGTREGTHANSTETVRALAERFGAIAHMHQVHGNRVAMVEHGGLVPETDAIITAAPELWLAVKTADCVPILISSPRAVAAIHAGWRSTEQNILPKTIGLLCTEFNQTPEDLHLALGPCLSQPHFEVEATFQHRFTVRQPERFFSPSAKPGHEESHVMMDLAGILRAQAHEAGMLDIHLHSLARCTYAEAATFNSYRRFQQGKDAHYATQVSLIRRQPEGL